MKRHTEFSWIGIVSGLFLTTLATVQMAELTSTPICRAAETDGTDADRLTVRIDLDNAQGRAAIDIDKPLRVVLTNNSDKPISIWNPRTEKGYYQLAFQFANVRTGEKHPAHMTVVPSSMFPTEGVSETVEIPAGGSFTLRQHFAGIWGEYRSWTGLPSPNSTDLFSVIAEFVATAANKNDEQRVWTGKIRSNAITAEIIASSLKTPLEYLWNGYPAKAIELMNADPKLISTRGDDECTPLHHAARFGHLDAVKWLLAHGADVNAIAYNGFTPLHLTNDPEVVELILQSKPDLTIRCRILDQTPLQRAVSGLVDARSTEQEKQWRTIVDLYLRAGAKYDLQTAIYLDDLDRVKIVLAESPNHADRGGSQGRSPLRVAASLGRLEICHYLIENFQVDVNDFNRGHGYPIIKGALAFPEVVRLLIDNGADLKTRITWRGMSSGLRIIGNDATLLHYAAESGVPETIRLLIDNGVDIFATDRDFDDARHRTALEVAAILGRADNASAIVKHPKFAAAALDSRMALLEKCLRSGAVRFWLSDNAARPLLVNFLLEEGANPNKIEKGVTVMQFAARQIHPNDEAQNQRVKQVVSLLRKHGATVDLFSAVAIGDEEEVSKLLKENRPSANSRGPDGYPALHFAVGMDYRGIVEALLAAGGDIDIRNRSEYTGAAGETALHCAAFWGRNEIAKTLVDAGANVNALTDKKCTPLHDAARMGQVKIAKLLLDHGADPDARDNNDKTPLDWCQYNEDDMKKVLREHIRK